MSANEGRKLRVLFLWTGNSCRSQMAEGWARHLKGVEIEAFSAGIEKHGLNPRVAEVMAEAGVDINYPARRRWSTPASTIRRRWRRRPSRKKRRLDVTGASGTRFAPLSS
jgi:predicted protein tyrosine phosphatase